MPTSFVKPMARSPVNIFAAVLEVLEMNACHTTVLRQKLADTERDLDNERRKSRDLQESQRESMREYNKLKVVVAAFDFAIIDFSL